MEKAVLETARELISLMGIETTGLDVRKEDDKRHIFYLTILSPDSKLLIGPRGQTLAALEHFLGLISERAIGDGRVAVHVEVNDYRASQDARLYEYVEERIKDVMRTGVTTALRPMTSYERKKVHAYVGDKAIAGLSSASQDGPGGRTLHLSYAGKRDIGIDLDAAGI